EALELLGLAQLSLEREPRVLGLLPLRQVDREPEYPRDAAAGVADRGQPALEGRVPDGALPADRLAGERTRVVGDVVIGEGAEADLADDVVRGIDDVPADRVSGRQPEPLEATSLRHGDDTVHVHDE